MRTPSRSLALLALLFASCSADAPERPNLLLITVDTLRADRLGAYGYERDTTPELDAWFERAVRFEDAQATSSWTLASLASLMTGLPTTTHGCWNFKSQLDDSFVTLAELLSARGYLTAAVPSHIFLGSRFGLHQGFGEYDESLVMPGLVRSHEAISSPAVSNRGLRWLEEHGASEQPWFLWLHYFDPHATYKAHAGVSEQFGVAEDEDLYDGEIAFTDKHLGRVLELLDERGLHEDTLVVFVADHGEEWYDHGRVGHGSTLYDEQTRVPLAISAPGLDARVVEESVSLMDVLPTLLELCDLPLQHEVAGRSLTPLLAGEAMDEQPLLLELHLREKTELAALVDGPWKLVLARGTDEVLLFDRATDPGEQTDLAAQEPARVERMRAELDRLVQRAELRARDYAGGGELELAPDELSAIDDLGYTGEDDEVRGGDERDD